MKSPYHLTIIRGLPGSGKTTMATKLGLTYSIPTIDIDILAATMSETWNDELIIAIRNPLITHNAVIVSGVFHKRVQIDSLIEKVSHNLKPFTVKVTEPSNPWSKDPTKCYEKCVKRHSRDAVPLGLILKIEEEWEKYVLPRMRTDSGAVSSQRDQKRRDSTRPGPRIY